MNARLVLLSFCTALSCLSASALAEDCCDRPFVILHTNDLHSAVAGVDSKERECLSPEKCSGGWERIESYVKEAKDSGKPVLFVDSGDQWQGTLFFNAGGPEFLSELSKHMGWDAGTPGNHELDFGCEKAAQYFESLPYPILAANLIKKKGCAYSQSKAIQPWIIKDIKGVKVGIIGLANDEVREKSKACPETEFMDRVFALKKALIEIKREKPELIVVLSHLGYDAEVALTKKVPGNYVLVGAHSHDVLGKLPDAVGDYPTVIDHKDGTKAYVVTAGSSAQYIGELNLCLSPSGQILSAKGQDVKLDQKDYLKDPELEAKIDEQAQKIRQMKGELLALNEVDMTDGPVPCRRGSCFTGSLVTRALLTFAKKDGAQMALVNSGSIRQALPVGEIRQGDLKASLPYQNGIELVKIKGAAIPALLEYGAREAGAKGSSLIQAAGLRYTLESENKPFDRIRNIQVDSGKDKWEPLDINKEYTAVVNDYLVRGKDGYKFPEGSLTVVKKFEGANVNDVFADYLRKRQIITGPIRTPILRK